MKNKISIIACAAMATALFSVSLVQAQNHPFVPGNAIAISAFPDSVKMVSGIYPIDENGCIDIPKAGLVQVTNSTDSQLVAFLRDTYIDYLRYPTVQVRPLIRVGMTGGFNQPGLLYADPRSNLWQLVQQAGGTKRADGLKLVRWQRNGQVLSANLQHPIESGMSLANLGVRSGDQFWVTDRPPLDVLPVLSVALAAITTSVTVFLAYEAYKGNYHVVR